MSSGKRFHYYHQVEQSDCGVTCLRMVARHFGKTIPAKTLRGRADLSRGGISLRGLKDCAESVGMRGYGVKLSLDNLKDAPLPAILHWNQNHFAVLWKIDRGIFHVADPAGGMLKYSLEEFRDHFCGNGMRGIALLLAPTEEFYAATYPRESRLKKIAERLRGNFAAHRRAYALIAALALLTLVADLFVPLLMRRSIDEGIEGKDISLVWLLVMAQIAIFIGSQMTASTSSFIVNRLGLRLSLGAVDSYLTKLVSLPMRFFDSRVSADLIQKSYDQEQMQQYLLETPVSLVLTMVNILLFSGILLWFNPVVFAGFLILTAGGLLWEGWMLRRRRGLDYDIRTVQSRNNNNVYEIVNGIADLKIHSAHNRRVALWRSLQQRLNRLRQRSDSIRLVQSGGAGLIYQTRDIAINGLCATLVISDAMTFGTMITVAFVAGRLSSGFSSVSSSLTAFQQTSISLDRSNDVMDEPVDERVSEIESVEGDISLSHISYSYPGSDSRKVIDDLSVTIPRGKTTAIVGPSGCGKSTLMKLLQGLYSPAEGQLLAGGTDIASLSAESWGKICTSVSQSGYVFSDTIARNIALGDEEPDMGKVMEAVRMACLDTLTDKLPLATATLIGPSGMELSGGERQRLMIARAIYRDTPVILLDEATSSLDAETERRIVENLAGFGQGRTMVIAAHRLSTVSRADLILFMDSGRIIEQGTHRSLVSLGGRYASFVSGQLTT